MKHEMENGDFLKQVYRARLLNIEETLISTGFTELHRDEGNG